MNKKQTKNWGHALSWLAIGDSNSTSVYSISLLHFWLDIVHLISNTFQSKAEFNTNQASQAITWINSLRPNDAYMRQ